MKNSKRQSAGTCGKPPIKYIAVMKNSKRQSAGTCGKPPMTKGRPKEGVEPLSTLTQSVGRLVTHMDERREHLIKFYSLLGRLEKSIGTRTLASCSGRMDWPKRGVYFFRELGELRSDTGDGLRIVRVGTHALKTDSRTKLWTRLSQHKGQPSTGGGNHRGSIFRLIVGAALISRDMGEFPTWGDGNTAKGDVRIGEFPLECEVSLVIGKMPFLWLSLEDDAGPGSRRGYVERNAIALLSNYHRHPLDQPSPHWLGRHCDREKVRTSGLWNSNHVDESYDPRFLDELERHVSAVGGAS